MQNPKKRNQKMRKMRLMSGVLAVTMTASLLALPAQAASISDFTDVEGHWAYDALEWAVENDVLAGKDHDTMDPDGLLTRAQMATMMDRLYGTYKNADISHYTDVVTGSWYYNYIAQAVNMGTLTGYGNGLMKPNDYITREQAVVVIARTLCLMAASNEDLTEFPDEIGRAHV